MPNQFGEGGSVNPPPANVAPEARRTVVERLQYSPPLLNVNPVDPAAAQGGGTAPPSSGSGVAPYTTPVNADFVWRNQGTSTVTDANGFIHLEFQPSGADNILRARVKQAPATPYRITAALRFRMGSSGSNIYAGLLFRREDGTGQIEINSFGYFANAPQFFAAKFTDESNFNQTLLFTAERPLFPEGVMWFRLADDGTTLSFSHSMNGFDFVTTFSHTRAASIFGAFNPPTQIGVFGSSNDVPLNVDVLSWLEEVTT